MTEKNLLVLKNIVNHLLSKGEKWYDKLFNVKYLPLFHHFEAIYQFPKHNFFGQNCS
jgi:hypothetical protein